MHTLVLACSLPGVFKGIKADSTGHWSSSFLKASSIAWYLSIVNKAYKFLDENFYLQSILVTSMGVTCERLMIK